MNTPLMHPLYATLLAVLESRSSNCLDNDWERAEVAQALLPLVLAMREEAYSSGFNAGLERAIELIQRPRK